MAHKGNIRPFKLGTAERTPRFRVMKSVKADKTWFELQVYSPNHQEWIMPQMDMACVFDKEEDAIRAFEFVMAPLVRTVVIESKKD